MKFRKSICLAACLLALLLTACGQTTPEYPELAELDLESMELSAQENSLVRVSYDPENWVPQPMTDPMMLVYADTLDEDFVVNFCVQYVGEYTGRLNESFLEELLPELEELYADDETTVDLAELRQLRGEPVICIESTMGMTDARIDRMLADGTWTEAWIDSIGGREALLEVFSHLVTVHAVTDGRLINYTGAYIDEAYKQPLLDAMATAIATTEWVGP